MNEDFVSFSLSKKLKEKGFNVCVYGHYRGSGVLSICNTPINSNALSDEFSAPTISQVLKWLREEKKVHIIVEIANSGWYYTLSPNVRWENGTLKSDEYIMSFKPKDSYEAAALAGIEHVIDKLI